MQEGRAADGDDHADGAWPGAAVEAVRGGAGGGGSPLRHEGNADTSEARRHDQNAVLRKYQAQRLQGYLDESLRDRQRLRRRALRKDPGVRDVAFGFCALGIALGASVITMVAAFML